MTFVTALHPWQHLVRLVFLVCANLSYGKWHPVVFLIYIFLNNILMKLRYFHMFIAYLIFFFVCVVHIICQVPLGLSFSYCSVEFLTQSGLLILCWLNAMQMSSASLWFVLEFCEPSQTTDCNWGLRMDENDDLESSGLLLLWIPHRATNKLCRGEKWGKSTGGSLWPSTPILGHGDGPESHDHHSCPGES